MDDIFDQSDDAEAKYLDNQFRRNIESWQRTGYREALVGQDEDDDDQSPHLQAAFDAGYAAANQLSRRASKQRATVALICQMYEDKILLTEDPSVLGHHLVKLQSLREEWEKVSKDLQQLTEHLAQDPTITSHAGRGIKDVTDLFETKAKHQFDEKSLTSRTNDVLCTLNCPIQLS